MSATKKSAGGAKATSSATQSGVEACVLEARGPAGPLHCAGHLFGEIAAGLHTANEVVREAVQTPEPAALLVALSALLEKLGSMADRAGLACRGNPCVQDQESWLLSPSGAKHLSVLEAMRYQGLVGRGHAEQQQGDAA